MPKTMPMMFVSGKRVAGSTITRTGWAVTVLASIALLALALGAQAMKRSNAPIFWLLFGAGGMLSALFATMLGFIMG